MLCELFVIKKMECTGNLKRFYMHCLKRYGRASCFFKRFARWRINPFSLMRFRTAVDGNGWEDRRFDSFPLYWRCNERVAQTRIGVAFLQDYYKAWVCVLGVREQDMQMYDSDVNNTATLSTSPKWLIRTSFVFASICSRGSQKIVRQIFLCSCIMRGCQCEINLTYSFIYVYIRKDTHT